MSGRKIRQAVIVGLAAGMVAAGAAGFAAAQTAPAGKPMGKMTCSEFLKLDAVAQPKYIYFATAYAKGGKPEDAVIDIVSVDKLVPVIVEDCQRNLNTSYYARVKEQFGKAAKGETKK